MKRIITFGDVHGRPNWKKNLDPTLWDLIIFIGDYVDSFDIPGSLMIGNLEEIIKLKQDYPDKVILLIGNHDIQYMHLNRYELRCSGFRPEISPVLHQLFESNRNLFQLCHHENINGEDIVWSHAGFTESWFQRSANCKYPFVDRIEDLNSLVHMGQGVSIIAEVSPSRGGYDRPGPLWADKRDLVKNPVDGISQIVGHTQLSIEYRPFSTINLDSKNKIVFIDNASECPHEIG